MLVKLDHLPRDRGENKKYLKPPTRSCLDPAEFSESSHHLAVLCVFCLNFIHLNWASVMGMGFLCLIRAGLKRFSESDFYGFFRFLLEQRWDR